MKPVGVDEIADELYQLAPDEFTHARDEAARAATDPASKAIKGLRKPTASAHAVNRLVRDRAADIDGLLHLGEQLRAAMAASEGDVVRQLTEQRRALVGRLVADLADGVKSDVVATLEAATADPDLAAAVRSGRLVKPLHYAGFGALPDVRAAVATPAPTRRSKPVKKPKPAAAELDAARRRVLELAGTADDAQRRYEAAVRAAVEARARLDEAEAERAQAHRVARAAHAEAEQARRELGRLERS